MSRKVNFLVLVAVGIAILFVYVMKLSTYGAITIGKQTYTLKQQDISKTIDGYLQDMQYRTTTQTAELKFNISRIMLINLGFPIMNFSADVENVVFVTAAGGRSFHAAMDAIALIQTWFPTNTIYFYDLENRTAARIEKIRQLCNVKYRQFNYSRYPTHVQNLRTYSFKPLLIHEVLHDHSNVFWVDASIRFKTGNLTAVVNQTIKEGRGLMTFDSAGHSNFAATHALMYRYLPITTEDAVKTDMRGACAIFIQSNKQLYDNVLRWWFLCALVHNCMAPTRDLVCQFKDRDVYANCHRYDQSALNILLVNYFNSNDRSYYIRYNVLSVKRGAQHEQELFVCENDTRLDGNLTRAMSKDYFV